MCLSPEWFDVLFHFGRAIIYLIVLMGDAVDFGFFFLGEAFIIFDRNKWWLDEMKISEKIFNVEIGNLKTLDSVLTGALQKCFVHFAFLHSHYRQAPVLLWSLHSTEYIQLSCTKYVQLTDIGFASEFYNYANFFLISSKKKLFNYFVLVIIRVVHNWFIYHQPRGQVQTNSGQSAKFNNKWSRCEWEYYVRI